MEYSCTTRWTYLLGALFLALIYLAVGFYPFHVKTFANHEQTNGAVPLSNGGIQFPTPGIAYTEEAPAWLREAIATSQLDISLEIRTTNHEQVGPARIFTLSSDRSHRNLTIGQWGPNLSVRIRTPDTSDNGSPPYAVKNVFTDSNWHKIDIRITPRDIEANVDGHTSRIAEISDKALKDWDDNFRVGLGNELSGDYPWLGEIRKAVVRVGDQSVDYLVPEELLYPERFTIKNYHAWKIIPFTDAPNISSALRDWTINLVGFVPFGWLVAKSRQPRQGISLAIVLSATVSFIIELGQLLIFNDRYPSTADVIMNMFGGSVGAWIATRSALWANDVGTPGTKRRL